MARVARGGGGNVGRGGGGGFVGRGGGRGGGGQGGRGGRGGGPGGRGGGRGRGGQRRNQGQMSRFVGTHQNRNGPPSPALTLLQETEGLERRVVMVLMENSYIPLLRESIIANATPEIREKYGFTHLDSLGHDPSVLLKIMRDILLKPIAGLREDRRAATLKAVKGILKLRHKNAHALLRALLVDQTIGYAVDNLEIVVTNLFQDGHWQLVRKVENEIREVRFRYSV